MFILWLSFCVYVWNLYKLYGLDGMQQNGRNSFFLLVCLNTKKNGKKMRCAEKKEMTIPDYICFNVFVSLSFHSFMWWKKKERKMKEICFYFYWQNKCFYIYNGIIPWRLSSSKEYNRNEIKSNMKNLFSDEKSEVKKKLVNLWVLVCLFGACSIFLLLFA